MDEIIYDVRPLIRARKGKGWDQTALALKAGLSKSTICRVEKGERQRPQTFKKIATALGVDLSDLVQVRKVRKTA